jgi:hypothetical protein
MRATPHNIQASQKLPENNSNAMHWLKSYLETVDVQSNCAQFECCVLNARSPSNSWAFLQLQVLASDTLLTCIPCARISYCASARWCEFA